MNKKELNKMVNRVRETLNANREHMLSQEKPGTDHIESYILCLEMALDEKNEERIYQECLNLDEFSNVDMVDMIAACMSDTI